MADDRTADRVQPVEVQPLQQIGAAVRELLSEGRLADVLEAVGESIGDYATGLDRATFGGDELLPDLWRAEGTLKAMHRLLQQDGTLYASSGTAACRQALDHLNRQSVGDERFARRVERAVHALSGILASEASHEIGGGK